MENEWTPPSDAVEVTGSSFVPPSDSLETVKKKVASPSTSVKSSTSSERLTTTTTKATVSSSSKGKPNGIYSYPGNENYVYKKEGGQWFVASKSDYKYMPLKTGDVQGRINLLEKKAVSLEQYGFETEPRKEAPLKYTAPAAPKPIAKPKTEAQQREQELFDKEFKALDKTDPEYLRKKAQADAIAARVNQITPDFINDNEEDVVPKVQQLIKDYPYLQVSQSGGGYDELEIVNTVTNERKKINLENWTSDRDREEAKRLQGFLDVQMSSKEYINQYQKVNKIKQEMEAATPTERINLSQKLLEEQAKLNDLSGARYNYAKNDKYRSSAIYDKNAKENIKVDFAKLQLQSIDYAEKANDFKKWNDTVEESRRKGLITEEQYLNDYLPKLEQEKQMLLDEQIRIKDDFRKTKSDSVAIDNIAADEYAIQAERGNVLTGATYSALQGAENSLRFLLESGDFKDGEFKGFLTGFAPGSISDEYTSAEGRNAFEQIVFGLANSGGSALVGAAAGVPFLGLYASAYVNTKDQMSGPEFADVPEYQKILFSGALGATVGLLEKYGISKWFTKTPAGKGLTNWVLKKTIAEIGKDASSEAIDLAVKKNLGAAFTNGLIQVTASGLVEGSTELAQEAADIGFKEVFNAMSEKELFDNPKTWGGVADRLSQSFLLGFAGGAGLQSMTQTLDVASNELNKSQINAIEQMIDSPELKETFRLNLKDQILSGQITKEKAQALAERFNELEGTLNKIPKNVDRFEAFKLINERDEIQKEIAGKDPALVAAQTERVSEINEQLKQLSKDAVQKQTTSEVPVQPGAAVSGEMAQGESEAGPQEVTQEGQKYQEVGQQTTTQINVAPLFDTKVKTVEEADAIRQSDMYKQYKDNLSKVATDFNVTVDTIDDTIGGYAGVAEVSTVATVSGDWNDIIKFAAAYGALTPEVQDSTIAGRTVEPQTTEHNADRFDIGINNQEAALKAAEDAGFSEDGFTLSGDKIMFFNIFDFPVKDFDNKYATFVDKYLEYGGQITSESKSAVQSEFIDSFRRAEILTEAERNAVQQAGREGLRNAVQEAKQRNFPYTVAKAKADQINLVSKENIDEVISNQDTATKQKLAKNAKLALRAIPDAKIYLHNTQSEYDAAVGEETDGTEKGAFIAQDGAIHINMEEALPHTLLHEAFHYVILNKGIDGKTLTGWANALKSIVKDDALIKKIENLTKNYNPEEQSEEFIAELGSIMAEAKDTLSTSALVKFKALINKIASKIGLPAIFSAEATTQDAVDFINRIGKQLVKGEEITPGDGGEVGTFTIPKRKLQKAASVSNDPRDFIREFVEDVDLREFNGKKFITNMYDYTNAGETDLGNGFKINMLGGKNYVPLMMSLNNKKIGDVSNLAAFNTKEQAETFIRNAELGGANLFAPHSGTLSQSWQFQQHTFAELFNLVLDSGILTSKELMDVFNNTIKDSEANQAQFNAFAKKYGEKIKNFDSFKSDPKKIIDLLDIKNNYSPKLRKALNNAIASNKKFQKAIGVNNKMEFYERIMDPLNQGMTGGEIMNIVDFDPTTFQIVETKPDATDHHPSFGWTLLAKINGIYQPTELYKSVDITDSYTKYNKGGEEISRKAEEPKFEQKNVSSSAGAIPKTAEVTINPTEWAEEKQQYVEDIKNEVPSYSVIDQGKAPKRKKQIVRKEAVSKIESLSQDQFEKLRDIAFDPAKTPKKTVIAYKLFKVKKDRPGQIFPLFVNANESVPTDVWIKAVAGPTQVENGKVKVKSKLGPLAYRPGWHSGVVPVSTHIGGRSNPSDKKAAPDLRPADQVWAEIEVSNDVDWQTEATKRAKTTKKGTIDLKTAHITDQLPIGGHYRYKTNSNMTGDWLISGEIKLTGKILTDEEVKRINDENNTADLGRTEPFDYAKYGFDKNGYPVDKKKAEVDQIIDAYLGAMERGSNPDLIKAIDNLMSEAADRKQQKGLSKAQAINAAKDKYDLSVKQRGNTHAQGVESALNDLRKSDWYVESDDIMREEAERELKKFFGQRIKSAPSVGRLMGVKPTKVQVDEAAALKSQLRLEAKAAREAKMDLNAKRKALVSAISAMVKDGKISTRQSNSIINKVGKVNLDNPVMVERLINYAEKVFQRADYQERLSEASKIRKSIRRSLKSKELQAEVAGMAKMFTKVDPFLVEDIDQYISNAENVLNAVRPVRGLEVAIRQAADIAAINEFVTEQIELQEKNKKAELMAVYNYLVESGAITEEMTSKEMQDIIDIINTEESEINDPEKKMNFLKNRFEFMAGIIQKMIVNNEDPFTEESLDLNDRQKELMRQLLKIDMDRLSVKQAALVLEAMDNFMNNGITSGVEAVIKNYQGALNADRLASSGKRSRPLKMYFSKGIGKLFGEQFVSLPLLIERMFPGMKNGLKLMSDMGLTDVIKGTAKADYEHKQLVKEYTEQGFYKQKGFMNAENVYERGMLAFLSRNLIGTETERQNEFIRRVKILEESIKELEAGSAAEVKMADLYQKAYDKLKVSDRDIDVIKANAEKMNLEAVEWMTNQWASKYDQLADVSLSVYNSILGSDTNYTPDRYKGLEGADLELDEDLLNRGSAFMSSLDYTNKNKSGVLIETTRPKNLPANRYISLDFDTNNFASLKGAMIDIETAPAIRQVDGFLKSDGYKRMVNGDDRKILTSRVNNYISAVKGKTNFNRDTLKSVERLANFLGSLGVGKALGGLDQAVKQTTPVIVNTIMNAGRFTPLNMDMNVAINRSGMPIANRGIESITAVESIDSLIDKKSTTAAEAVKVVEKISQMYMKALLSKPDVWVARSSFITYYQKYLRDNGMDTNIDWKEHEWNKDAMEYAQMMVDRQQNISDEKLAGKFLSSRDPMVSVARKVIFPFATFILNQKARMHNDFIALFGSDVSTDDRAKAVKSLGGLAAEMITYQAIAYFIKTMVYDNIASYIAGEDDEEEKKERSFFGIKMTKKQWNATKFPVKSFVSDLISPLPLTDDLVTFGFDKLMSNFPMITQEEINQSIKDQNDARALKGQDPMDAEMEANFIEKLKQQNTYSVTFKTDGVGRAYGVPGIAFDTYMELADMAKMATTGEFVEDIGYGPKTKHLSKNDQELVKYMTIPMVLYTTGLVPKDFGTVARKVVNTAKKRSINDNKFKNISALKDELGRKPKEWEESLVMDTQKKLPTIIETIQFAERFGGLTESQGKEFAKLIELSGDYNYFNLKRIQEGETADQILKK
jgi:hypothetical protein